MKFFKFILRKVICSAFLLYGYNLIATSFQVMVPINPYTLSVVSLLGSSGLVCLALFKYLIL